MRVAVVIPACNEAERIAATVAAAARIPAVDVVLVVDDGSTDDTARIAIAAGARAERHARNRGKAAAMTTGAAALPDADVLVFLDADLGDTAVGAAPLLAPVLEGRADMTIATLPTQATAGGGHGFVVRLSRWGIERATGFAPVQPLSGQRCLTRAAFARALPLAPGFGVETALTIDLLRAGLRVQEVPCDLLHRVTGTDWRAQRHRLRQFRHVARALATRIPLLTPKAQKRG
jgi:glycosyltransferase involved in cell wall biosynthesis